MARRNSAETSSRGVQGQGTVGSNLSDYMPSRIETAERMLEVAGVGPDQVFLDIGSGDGRLVVLAARAGAEAIGIDRQELLVERARDNAAMAGVADRARFVHADARSMSPRSSSAPMSSRCS